MKKKHGREKPISKDKAPNVIKCGFQNNRSFFWLSALIAALITSIVYLPALQNGFVNWDDDLYVYENPNIRSLDFRFLKWCLTAVVVGPWTPLTLFSFGLDYALWGLKPWGYHLVNIIFHALNTLLVFVLSIQLLDHGSPKGCWQTKEVLIIGFVTAVLFGIHPLHVESVAWVTERKDVLSAFFYILSIILYLKYSSAIKSKPIFYIASLSSFALALLSKPMAVSLPIVLLIIDFYPLGRLKKGVLLEKLPFFALSLLTSLITLWAHISSSGGIKTLEELPYITRCFVAVRAYLFYLYKMILPLNLAPLYPYPKKVVPYGMEYVASIMLFAGATFFCIRSFNRNKLFFSIWSYYIVTLIPVIGLVQAGHQMAADRFTYLPSIGPFFLAAVAGVYAFERYKKYHILAIASFVIFSGALAFITIKQITIWRNSITLWSYEIKLFPTSELAYNNRAAALVALGNHKLAISDYNMAIGINPRYSMAYYNRGNAFINLGNYEEAIQDYSRAIELNRKYVEAYYNRGNTYKRLGKYKEAIADYNKVVEINPRYAEAFYNRGNTYYDLGDYQTASMDYNKTIELNPGHVGAYVNRGNIYFTLGNLQYAENEYQKAIKLDPRNTKAYSNLGSLYERSGNKELAAFYYNKAASQN